MKRYQKRDNRILQNLENQLKLALEDLEKKFKQQLDVSRMKIDAVVHL
jgi:BMFP domain-containing protein YqiC